MSNETRYVVKRTEGYNDELQHWGNKEDHKYVSKKMVNGKWVYTYPEDVKKPSSSFNTTGFNKPKFTGINTLKTKPSTLAVQKRQDKQAAATAERQNDSIKTSQMIQNLNNSLGKTDGLVDRINNAIVDVRDDLKTAARKASGVAARTKNKVSAKANQIGDKIDDVKDDIDTAKRKADRAAARTKNKVKKSINKTIKSAKKQINKGKKWLDNLFD